MTTHTTTPPTHSPRPNPAPNPGPNPGRHPVARVARHPLVARGLIRDTHGRWLIVLPASSEHQGDHGGGYRGAHGGGCWNLPGGLVEHNEPPSVACARDIREELALDLNPGALIAVGWTAPRHSGRHARVTFIFDMGASDASTLDGGVHLQQSELADWRWVSPEEALRMLHPDLAVRLAPHGVVDPMAVYTEHHPAEDRVTGTSHD